MGEPTTAVLCIARNELPFVDEWIEYHVGLGVDRIHFVSTDDDVDRVRAHLAASDFASHVELHHFDDFTPGWQMRCYNEFLPSVRDDWLLVIDLDEYLHLGQHDDLRSFLDGIPDDVGQVQFPWINVLPERYSYRRTFDILEHGLLRTSDHVKSLVRRDRVRGLGIHSHDVRPATNMLASGLEIPAHHTHDVLLREPGHVEGHPCIVHFCSRGHLDTLTRIADHRFFNTKNGEPERARARALLDGDVAWSDLPTRYLLLEVYRSMAPLAADLAFPDLQANTDVTLLHDQFREIAERRLGISVGPTELTEASLEARFGLQRKLADLGAPGSFDLDVYLAGGSQVDYVERVRKRATAEGHTIAAMTTDHSIQPSVERQWPGVRFHTRPRLVAPEAHVEEGRRIHALQADDDARFDAAKSGLLERLDLSRGAITGMTCDHRFARLFENWAASCDRSGIECRSATLVFPTDRVAFERIEALGFVAYFDAESELLGEMTESGQYGDGAWTKYMFHQNWVIKQLLGFDVDVLFQDVDVVWRHDPIPFLHDQARAGADIQAMFDGPNPRFQPLYANSGFMYFRASPSVREFWSQVYARHDMIRYYASQQEPLNVLLAAHAHRGLDVRILDEDRFANGHLYCGRRSPGPDPWVVHNSWTGTMSEKLDRYEAQGYWFLGDEELRRARADEERARAARRERARARRAAEAAVEPAVEPAAEPVGADDADDAESLRRASEALLELLGRVRNERDALQHAIDEIHGSRSWRYTQPLRRAKEIWTRRRR